jgi:hypothetical protein
MAEAVEHDRELAAGHLSGIELLDRAGGRVARIGVEFLPGGGALGVDPLELGGGQVDFPADLDHVRHRRPGPGFEHARQGGDGQDVGRNIIALVALAAGDGAHELPLLVSQADRQAVNLGLDGVTQVLGAKQAHESGMKGPHLVLAVGVVEADHPLPVRDLLETLRPVVTDLLRG